MDLCIRKERCAGRDVTGGAQGWVDTNFPGAFYKDAGVEYVCVCGKTVEGVKRGGTIWKREDPSPPSYAFNSYEQVSVSTFHNDVDEFQPMVAHSDSSLI